MKTGTLLDADMTTLARLFKDGANWWVNELNGMLPNWAQRERKAISGLVAHYGSDGLIRLDGEPQPLSSANQGKISRPATLLIPQSLCLIRQVSLPAMRHSDLRKLVMFDLDRLMPFAPDTAYADVALRGAASTDGKTDVAIAGLPKAQIQSIYETAIEAGLAPRAIGIADQDDASVRFDFLPGLVKDGVAKQTRSGAAFWWWLLAALFALNIGALIFRDMQSVSQLATLVESQQPAANAARRLAQRIANEDRVRSELIARRDRDNALAALAFVTRILPEGVWIQRYSWNGATLRLSGYKQSNVDVLAALRKSGRFDTVRASASDVAAESTTGQPFDITAEWRREIKR
jgi:Tfp pilus assembly protein PilN